MNAKREILVRIVAYRDPELIHTVASAWESADDASRVRFAIVQQHGPETESVLGPVRGDERVRIFGLPWSSARGLGWARRMTDRMRVDEAYSLQLDSHTRFAPGWDTALIEQWESRRDPRAVLSCYPGPFTIVDAESAGLHAVQPHLIVPAGSGPDGMPRQTAGPTVAGGTRGLLVAGGFQFSSGELCSQLEQVRDVMVGDEYVRALQLFTHGWTVTVPDTVPLYHLYARDKPAGGHGFIQDFESTPETSRVLARLLARSSRTANEIIAGEGAGASALGRARSRSDFARELAALPAAA